MPTVLYKWDFEDGTTQGWVLGSYSSLDSTSQIQGTYSIKFDYSIPSYSTVTNLVMYIDGVDLSTASRPMIVFVFKDGTGGAGHHNAPIEAIVEVYDSGGSLLLSRRVTLAHKMTGFTKIVAADLIPVAGRSNLRIRILQYNSSISPYTTYTTTYYDCIHIIDGGDKEYDVAVLALDSIDRIITYTIPDADRPLPDGVARFAVHLATSPHPLNEASDIFTYTAVTNAGSASITSTDSSHRHTSTIVAASPTYFNELGVRVYPKTAGVSWYGFDEKVVVTFWSTTWVLLAVYVFNVVLTINPYSPIFATAMINTTYGSTWSGQRNFDLKVHARSLGVRCYCRYLVGDNTIMQSGTVKVEVFSEDYSVKYGESAVDLTTGTVLRGSVISGLPVDTSLKLRISWSITASARVVIEVRPEFVVY